VVRHGKAAKPAFATFESGDLPVTGGSAYAGTKCHHCAGVLSATVDLIYENSIYFLYVHENPRGV